MVYKLPALVVTFIYVTLIVAVFAFDQPPLILSDTSRPFLEREAKITPEEFPIAQELKPFLEAGNYDAALNLLSDYQQPKSAALLLLESQLLMQNQRWRGAEALLLQALREMPDLLRGHIALATVYQQTERPLEARRSISRAISLGANEAHNYALLAFLNATNGDPHAAIGAYQQALMLDPENDTFRKGLLFALISAEHFDSAKSLLQEMLNKNPNDSSLWVKRANLSFKSGDESKALSSIETAIRLGDESKAVRHMAQQLHLKNESFSRAETLTRQMLDARQLELAELDLLIPWLAARERWAMIERLLTAAKDQLAASHAPLQSRFKLYEYTLLNARDRFSEAMTALAEAIELDPTNGDALVTMAKLKLLADQYAEAELLYLRAEQVEAVAFSAKLGRAQVYIYQGDYETALEIVEALIAENTNRSDLHKNAEIIRNLIRANQQ